MRVRVLALIATALAIAACNDAPSPTALNSTADGSTVVAPEAHFNHNDHHKPKWCREDVKPRHQYVYKRGEWGYYWDSYRDRHHRLHKVLRRELLVRWHLCTPPDSTPPDTTPPSNTPGSVDGTVKNNGAGAAGFPVFLLSTDGATVVASTTTGADGTGSFNFASVPAGSYLLCEADPFTEQWGFLGETRPQTGPSCPSAYAPLGFSVTVTDGAASSGFAFSNMQLD